MSDKKKSTRAEIVSARKGDRRDTAGESVGADIELLKKIAPDLIEPVLEAIKDSMPEIKQKYYGTGSYDAHSRTVEYPKGNVATLQHELAHAAQYSMQEARNVEQAKRVENSWASKRKISDELTSQLGWYGNAESRSHGYPVRELIGAETAAKIDSPGDRAYWSNYRLSDIERPAWAIGEEVRSRLNADSKELQPVGHLNPTVLTEFMLLLDKYNRQKASSSGANETK